MNKKFKIDTKKISYRSAINQALHQEMERDHTIFTYGIDVADYKGIFGSTIGLLEKFGRERVFSTPLSEEALLGFGLGAAINGLRPINVHIRVDFLLLAMNQLVNMIASYYYGSDGSIPVPLVIRAIIGKGWGQSYQHSKSLQSFFAHIPGLKVVMPTTPADAKGLLISAIRDNNPVVILEHRMLYDIEDEVPIEAIPTSFGKGRIITAGTDITMIATSYSVVEAVKAAEVLRKRGVSVEVVDPRSIFPFDEELMIKSVEKTGHCIIADYDWTFCGFSAEVATRIYEKSSSKLKSPILRLGFAPTHCPSARVLENVFYTNSIDLIRAVEKKLKLDEMDLSQEVFYNYENKFRGPF